MSLIRQLDVPVATVPHGKTVGGGHILTMVGGVRIGVSGGTFSFGNITRGVTPVGGLCRMMTSAMGETGALSYYFRDALDSDGPLDTEQALARGILTHTVGTSEEGRALARCASVRACVRALLAGRRCFAGYYLSDDERSHTAWHSSCACRGHSRCAAAIVGC